ncbi:MAG: response regulator [Firmicutes bacterium]|nr:response regulator [Bacillota bacterium]MBR6014854.1 response regulator [Bacillota bacterium]
MAKITIISKGAVFMTDALVKNLETAGFEAKVVAPTIEAIGAERDDTSIYLLYAGDFVFESQDVFFYLKDTCIEDDRAVVLVGYKKEIDEIKNSVPDQVISHEFERPFDMKALMAELIKICQADEERRRGKNILLVDDDVTFLKIMKEWLSMKYYITVARSGMQAITYIANHKPDLILLDYDMPITPGPQVMEMIRSEHNAGEIPIIFLTGKSDKESVMRVMELKPQGYLLKSLSKEEIVEAVDNFFETKKWEMTM